MKQLTVGSQRIAYREVGTGPPLVLLHGWPLDSREFSRQLDGLAREFRVVAWDAPGAGRSSDPPETSRLEDWAHWLAAFIEALELAPAHVAGLSFGGSLALELFRQHPDVVRSLILMSAYAGWAGSLSGEEVQRRVQLTLANTELPPAQWTPALIDTLLPEGSDAGLADELATMIADAHPAATRTAIQALAETDLTDMLPEVDVPTLLLYGELDVRAPEVVRAPIHAGIAHSRLVVIPEVGHMVDMQAAERCNDEIAAFLHRRENNRSTSS
jgi:pimeloyl-ACP methyl ester carboxylesterase